MEEKKRQPCEIYSRVCGYLRPVKQWNDGMQAQFKERLFAHLNKKNDTK